MFQAGSCLTFGNLYSAKVIDTKDTGVDVVVDCERKTVSCLIPTPHLTDHASLASILLASVQTGNSLQALCFQQDVCPILTMKQSIIKVIFLVKNGTFNICILLKAEKNKSLTPKWRLVSLSLAWFRLKSYGTFNRLDCGNFNKTALVPTR